MAAFGSQKRAKAACVYCGSFGTSRDAVERTGIHPPPAIAQNAKIPIAQCRIVMTGLC
jgi:hypothetical protein